MKASSPLMNRVIEAARIGDVDAEWPDALRIADTLVEPLLVSGGILNEDGGQLYSHIKTVANAFGFAGAQEEFSTELEIGAKSKSIELRIDEAANSMELAKLRGAYAFGLAVGMRLAGGAR